MYTIYQIEYGDTLENIARKIGTTVDNLKKINGFSGDLDLVVGSLIVIPKSEKQIFDVYRIKQGDSIYSIASKYNVDPETLVLLNGLDKDEYIYPNQEIMVPRDDVIIYITKEGDTVSAIINNLGVDANTFNSENERIFVIEDQLIVHKKETNG